jgi:hypothetical protein
MPTIRRFNRKGADQQKLLGQLSGGGRRAPAAAPGEDADRRWQPPPARRAMEGPRRRNAARTRGRVARVRRLRTGDLARSLASSTASARNSWPARATHSGASSAATIPSTSKTSGAASTRKPPTRKGSPTGRSPATTFRPTALRVVTGMEAPNDCAPSAMVCRPLGQARGAKGSSIWTTRAPLTMLAPARGFSVDGCWLRRDSEGSFPVERGAYSADGGVYRGTFGGVHEKSLLFFRLLRWRL